MLIIALDESGSFEGNSKIKLIGGIVYKSDISKNIDKEYKEEEARIEQFLKSECEKIGLAYPNGIHAIDLHDDPRKSILKDSVKKYLKNSGNYYITLMMKSKAEKEEIGKSNLVDEKYASNLYERMTWNFINDLLFYNENLTSEKDVILDLATRVIRIDNDKENLIKKYIDLGYNYNKYDNSTVFFLTNQQTFKAGLATKIIEDRIDREIMANFKVRPINYHKTEKDKQKETTPMLYMADLVCDILREFIDINKPDFNYEEIHRNVKNITGKELLAWAFDDIDDYYSEIYDKANKGDYIEANKFLLKIYNSNSPFVKYYEKHWLSNLDSKITKAFDVNLIETYLNELRERLSRKSMASIKRKENIDFAIFLGENLWRIVNENKENLEVKTIYSLADLLFLAYNRNGNIKKANYYFDICKSLRTQVHRDDYFGTCLSYAQLKINEFDLDNAINVLLTCSKRVKVLKDILTVDDFGDELIEDIDNSTKYALLGKVYSTLGQLYSYKGEFDEAEIYFSLALDEFEDNSADRRFTIFLFAHSLIENRNYDDYSIYSNELFNSNDHIEQLGYISENGDSFGLWLWLKALDKFNLDINKYILDNITDVLKDSSSKFTLDSHPMEFVYKYLSKLYVKYKDDSGYKLCKDKINVILNLNGDLIIYVLSMYCKLQIHLLNCKDKNLKKNIINEFKECINENESMKKYFNEVFTEDIDETIDLLNAKFLYLYN